MGGSEPLLGSVHLQDEDEGGLLNHRTTGVVEVRHLDRGEPRPHRQVDTPPGDVGPSDGACLGHLVDRARADSTQNDTPGVLQRERDGRRELLDIRGVAYAEDRLLGAALFEGVAGSFERVLLRGLPDFGRCSCGGCQGVLRFSTVVTQSRS